MTRAIAACALALASATTGCVAPATVRAPAPPASRFEINGAMMSVPEERLQVIRRNWTDDSVALAETSRSNRSDHRWILDFVALNEALGPTPCHHLAIQRIDPLPLNAMTVSLGGERHTFTPRKYNEDWHVDACGVAHRWRVMDDADDARHELTVLLFPVARAASAAP